MRKLALAVAALVLAVPLLSVAEYVHWVDWTSGVPGGTGSAVGVIDTGSKLISVNYVGEIAFIQTAGGINYWEPSVPYISALVDNAPPAADIIALSSTPQKTLTFSEPVDNLFFAVVSLNANGWVFDEDFSVVSYGHGYWGDGTLTRVVLPGPSYMTTGTGEPHGVLRFDGAVSTIAWTSQAAEYWNGFTVGTYGGVPEPTTGLLACLGALAFLRRCREAGA